MPASGPAPESTTGFLVTMISSLGALAVAVVYALLSSRQSVTFVRAIPSAESVGSDLRLLFQNDLDCGQHLRARFSIYYADLILLIGHTTTEHISTILLSSRSHTSALSTCSKLSESLLPINGPFFASDTKHLVDFLALETGVSSFPKYWVASDSTTGCTAVSAEGLSRVNCEEKLPTFCSNSAPHRISNQTDLSEEFQVTATSGNLTFTGYVDFLHFLSHSLYLHPLLRCSEHGITYPFVFWAFPTPTSPKDSPTPILTPAPPPPPPTPAPTSQLSASARHASKSAAPVTKTAFFSTSSPRCYLMGKNGCWS